MEYIKQYYNFKPLPDFQDGDVIDGGNYCQAVVVEVSANLTIRNNPNLHNINFTGEITAESNYQNAKKDYCYWEHLTEKQGIIPLPVEDEICRHVYDYVEIDEETPIPLRRDIEL